MPIACILCSVMIPIPDVHVYHYEFCELYEHDTNSIHRKGTFQYVG